MLHCQVDHYNHLIRRIDLSPGLVSTLAGSNGTFGSVNGFGTSSLFRNPLGVSMDATGTIALVVSNIEWVLSRVCSKRFRGSTHVIHNGFHIVNLQ